jgi:hypothetical protein
MQHIIPNVTAKYPRLNATYKFDSVEQRSVKCDPLDDGAAYEMQFVMDMRHREDPARAVLGGVEKRGRDGHEEEVAGETQPFAIQEKR